MYLLLSILLSAALGYILMIMGPLVGGIVAFGIVVGSIFRGLYLLNDIHKRILHLSPEAEQKQVEADMEVQAEVPDHLKSARAYKNYRNEKE